MSNMGLDILELSFQVNSKTNDECNFRNQSKISTSKDNWNYMAFTFFVEYEREKEDRKIENLEHVDFLQEESDDEDL